MATVDSNFFELQRRSYMWSANSTLDDGSTSMLWDADPNTVVNGNTDGETKLYSLPIGAFYLQSDGTLWFKTTMPNTWVTVAAGVVSSSFADNAFELYDNASITKKINFDASAVTAGQTTTLGVQDIDGTIAYQEDFSTIASSGVIDGTLTYVTKVDETHIDVLGGTGYLRTTNDQQGTLVRVTWSASNNIAVAAGVNGVDNVVFVGIEYNSGSPQVTVRSSFNWNWFNDFPLARVSQDGTVLRIFNAYAHAEDVANNTRKRFRMVDGIRREEAPEGSGGLIIGETGARYVTMSAGNAWFGYNQYILPAIATNTVDTFDSHYRNLLGGFTHVTAQTQWPNTQYDDGSGTLQNLGVAKFACLWIYLDISDGTIDIVYGRASHNTQISAAAESAPATIPGHLIYHGKLLGRIIFKQGDSTATAIESVFATTFATTGITDHNNLANVQLATTGVTYGHITDAGQSIYGVKTFASNPIFLLLNASQLVATNSSAALQSLDTATYPSLAELAYVKGVTSAIQTQINTALASINPVGTILPYGGNTAPTGYLLCNRSSTNRTTYAALFAVIAPDLGTTTMTIASPCVVTKAGHGLSTGEPVEFTTTGALPTGITAYTNYFIIKIDANTFNIATTYALAISGTKVNTSGTQSGTHSIRHIPFLTDTSTTFLVPDGRAVSLYGAGTSTQFTTNENLLLGHLYDDQAQGHAHYSHTATSLSGGTTHSILTATGGYGTTSSTDRTGAMISDTVNGTPRFGTVTRSKALIVNFIIKT